MMNDGSRFAAMAARAFIDWYGIDAAALAAARAAMKLKYGDPEGARVWVAVRAEIERRQGLAEQGAAEPGPAWRRLARQPIPA
jgi:hypothetical protein